MIVEFHPKYEVVQPSLLLQVCLVMSTLFLEKELVHGWVEDEVVIKIEFTHWMP